MCNNQRPLLQFPIDESVKSHLCDLFEADSLSDLFKLSDANGCILTGNYGDSFHIIDERGDKNIQYELNYDKNVWLRQIGDKNPRKNMFSPSDKVLNHDFNKVTGQIAVSTHNCFFVYSKNSSP